MRRVVKIIRTVIGISILALSFILMFRTNIFFFSQEIASIQKTITEQRQVANPVELTTISDTIVKLNVKLDKYQKIASYDKLEIVFDKSFKELERIR